MHLPVTSTAMALVATAIFLPKRSSAEHTLVKDGVATSAIIAPASLTAAQQMAVDDFRATIRRASGADIPVLTPSQRSSLPESAVQIVLATQLAEQLTDTGVHELKSEEFLIRSADNAIAILARDLTNGRPEKHSLVTTWALTYLLDRHLGVRWLWPGELGTVVPKQPTITLPELDVRYQPPLKRRSLSVNFLPKPDEADAQAMRLWTAHHQAAGERVDYRFAHSFRKGKTNGDWWGRFNKAKPDMLAKNPNGDVVAPRGKTDRVKICISNPDVTTEILRLWREAGRPDFWDITPNDGNGFCTCDNCQTLDQRYGDITYTKDEIWNRPSHVNLTDRYVWFWNQLVRAMREENPNAQVGVYFYSAYRDPPRKLRLEDGIIGEIVHGFDFAFWNSWQAVGANTIGLRPNWWHMGANAPHLPLETVGAYIEQARDNGMSWIAMDSLVEYWATQGPYYYLVGRLIARPDLTTNEIIAEYCDAFGSAAADVARYLDYWEEYHDRVAYNIPAGGSLSQDASGIYETVAREQFGSIPHPLRGHWTTLPYVYPPEVIADAREILKSAHQNADDEVIRKRVEFLDDGLTQLEKTIAVLAAKKSDQADLIRSMKAFAKQAREKYGYWGYDGLWLMRHWGAIGKEVDLDGL